MNLPAKNNDHEEQGVFGHLSKMPKTKGAVAAIITVLHLSTASFYIAQATKAAAALLFYNSLLSKIAYADEIIDSGKAGAVFGKSLLDNVASPSASGDNLNLNSGLTIKKKDLFQGLETDDSDIADRDYQGDHDGIRTKTYNNTVKNKKEETTTKKAYNMLYEGYRSRDRLNKSVLNSPLWGQTDKVIADLVDNEFEECRTVKIPKTGTQTVHIEDLYTCNVINNGFDSCKIKREINIPDVIKITGGKGKIKTCGPKCLDIIVGQEGDNYYDGTKDCTVYTENLNVRVIDPSKISHVKLEYVRYDDYLQVYVDDRKIFNGPDSNFPPDTDGSCQLSQSRSAQPGTSLSGYFSQAGIVKLKNRTSVTGKNGGEGYSVIRVILKESYDKLVDEPKGCTSGWTEKRNIEANNYPEVKLAGPKVETKAAHWSWCNNCHVQDAQTAVKKAFTDITNWSGATGYSFRNNKGDVCWSVQAHNIYPVELFEGAGGYPYYNYENTNYRNCSTGVCWNPPADWESHAIYKGKGQRFTYCQSYVDIADQSEPYVPSIYSLINIGDRAHPVIPQSWVNQANPAKFHSIYRPIRCTGGGGDGAYEEKCYQANYILGKESTQSLFFRLERELPPVCSGTWKEGCPVDVSSDISASCKAESWTCTNYASGTINGVEVGGKNSGLLPGYPNDNTFLNNLCVEAVASGYKCSPYAQAEVCFIDDNGTEKCEKRSASNNCIQYEEDTSCQLQKTECVETTIENGSTNLAGCLNHERTYDCGYHEIDGDNYEEKVICDGEIRCMGEECIVTDDTESGRDDFSKTASTLQMLNDMKQDHTCSEDSTSCVLFQGNEFWCKKVLGGTVDCCERIDGINFVDYIKLLHSSWELGAAAKLWPSFGSVASSAWSAIANTQAGGSISSGMTAIGNTFTQAYESLAQTFSGGSASQAVTGQVASASSFEAIKQLMMQKVHDFIKNTFGEKVADSIIANNAGTYAVGPLLSTIMMAYMIYTIIILIIKIIYKCKDEEFEYMVKKQLKTCHELGWYCRKKIKILGHKICIEKRNVGCCYASPISRIIQEQIKKQQQVGLSWGTPEDPICQGITLSDMEKVDWDAVDLTEWENMLKLTNLPNAPVNDTMADNIMSMQNITAGTLQGVDGPNAHERVKERLDQIDTQKAIADALDSGINDGYNAATNWKDKGEPPLYDAGIDGNPDWTPPDPNEGKVLCCEADTGNLQEVEGRQLCVLPLDEYTRDKQQAKIDTIGTGYGLPPTYTCSHLPGYHLAFTNTGDAYCWKDYQHIQETEPEYCEP